MDVVEWGKFLRLWKSVGGLVSDLRQSAPTTIYRVQEQNVYSMGNIILPPHLQLLFEGALVQWCKVESRALLELLYKYQDVFMKNEYDLGRTHLVEHHIHTCDAHPMKLLPRRSPLTFAVEDHTEIKKLKGQSVIRSYVSHWATLLLMVSNNDGLAQMCQLC